MGLRRTKPTAPGSELLAVSTASRIRTAQMMVFIFALVICGSVQPASAFGAFSANHPTRQLSRAAAGSGSRDANNAAFLGLLRSPSPAFVSSASSSSPVVLRMSDSGGGGGGGGGGGTSREKTTKKGLTTITIDKTEQKMEEDEIKEEMWRVVLHNDEINTFQHVTRAITTVITTLDRKRAFDICMTTHGIGKATVTKTWRKKAEQYCLNLQRQGLTVSIAPDKAFGGGGGGGGDGGGEGGGGGGGGPDMS